MSLTFGDGDKDTIHNLDTSTNYAPTTNLPNTDFGGFPFPNDLEPTEVINSDAINHVVTTTISQLTEEEKNEALKKYYQQSIQSDTTAQRLNNSKAKLESKARMQEWVKYLLFFVTTLLLLSLIAIVVTIVYTSLSSGTMTETGIFASIVVFFTEIIRILING